ncbi:MAG TPA: LysR family transcriptional regulator [Jiangellaceae bacterium]
MADLEIADLRTFLAVVEAGSFSGAATLLSVAQPSVSARMATLERRLGVPLFRRSARGTTLTRAGEELARYARRSLRLLDEAGQAVRTAEGVQRLAIAAPAGLVSTVIPGVLDAISALRVDLRCWDDHSVDVVSAVQDGRAHAGFITHRAVPAGLKTRQIVRSPIVAMAAPGHPLVEHPGRTPAHLADLVAAGPVAVHGYGPTAPDLVAELRSLGTDHPVVHVSPGQAPAELAAYGGFVAIGPVCMFATALRTGTVRPLRARLPTFRMEVRLVHRTADVGLPVIQALVHAVPALRNALQPEGAPTSAGGRPTPARVSGRIGTGP